MMDTSGKLLERVLLQRLTKHLDDTRGLSPNQFGFRKGRSTEDAINKVLDMAEWVGRGPSQYQCLCVLVTIDVKNAFNTAPWDHIDAALRARGAPLYLIRMLRSYMTDRSLMVVNTNRVNHTRNVTRGVPQGSVLGPTLWNVFYDSLLQMETPERVQLIGFADNLAIVATSRTSAGIESTVNPKLDFIDHWMNNHGL